MLRNISVWHLLILLVVVLLVFGANRLPDLARSVGQSLKIFKSEVTDLTDSGRSDAGRSGDGPDGTDGATPASTTGAERPADGDPGPKA